MGWGGLAGLLGFVEFVWLASVFLACLRFAGLVQDCGGAEVVRLLWGLLGLFRFVRLPWVCWFFGYGAGARTRALEIWISQASQIATHSGCRSCFGFQNEAAILADVWSQPRDRIWFLVSGLLYCLVQGGPIFGVAQWAPKWGPIQPQNSCFFRSKRGAADTVGCNFVLLGFAVVWCPLFRGLEGW